MEVTVRFDPITGTLTAPEDIPLFLANGDRVDLRIKLDVCVDFPQVLAIPSTQPFPLSLLWALVVVSVLSLAVSLSSRLQ